MNEIPMIFSVLAACSFMMLANTGNGAPRFEKPPATLPSDLDQQLDTLGYK